MAVKKYDQCAYPSCDRNVLVSKLGLCPKHDDMFNFFIWTDKLLHKLQEGKTPSGKLYLPKQSNQKKGGE